MKKTKMMKTLLLTACAATVFLVSHTAVNAKTIQLDNGETFDSDYYADTYPDLKQAFGKDFDALLNHYLTYGIQEGRSASADAAGNAALTPIDSLANKNSLKKKCTDAEFQAAYDAAVQIVTPLIDLSKEEQLTGIASALRSMADSGQVVYSTSEAHYNDPYGYLVKGVASCAGCTRTTGLCLNILGISYEHVNENQWSHQWCRINLDGTYWICDAYGLYVGPEPAPYEHPYI